MTDNNKKMNSEPIFGNLAYDLNTLTWDPFDGSAVRQPGPSRMCPPLWRASPC